MLECSIFLRRELINLGYYDYEPHARSKQMQDRRNGESATKLCKLSRKQQRPTARTSDEGNKDHRTPATPIETALASDLREEGTTTSTGKREAELTFSSQDRQSAASSAAQKSTAGALSHTSQIVRIPTPRRSRRRQCHRSAAIRATKPRVPRLASPLPCDPFPALRCRRTTTAAAAAERDVDQEAAAETEATQELGVFGRGEMWQRRTTTRRSLFF